MKWIPIAVLVGILALAVPKATANDRVYTWIDENGVVNFTDTPPPEGARIIESQKEIPHDAQQARKRRIEQERYLEQLKREEQTAKQQAAEKPPAPEAGASRQNASGGNEDQQKAEAESRRQDTWHQRQIRERQREKLQEQKFGE